MSEMMTSDDRHTGTLEPDTVLPEQFFAALKHKAHADGERRLVVAVLEDAVNCFRKNLFAADPKAHQLFVEAEEWITAHDPSWFFSFANVCETLGLEPDYLREGLLHWKERQLRARREGHLGETTPTLRKASAG